MGLVKLLNIIHDLFILLFHCNFHFVAAVLLGHLSANDLSFRVFGAGLPLSMHDVKTKSEVAGALLAILLIHVVVCCISLDCVTSENAEMEMVQG